MRKNAGLTQEQLAHRMHMSRTSYCKLEMGQTAITFLHIQRLSSALDISMSQLFVTPNFNDATSELQFMRQSLESMIYSRLGSAEGEFEERIPFEELGELDWDWLRFNGIETRRQYEAAPMFVSRTSSAGAALAFAQVVQDMDIYSWFHHGIIQDNLLLKWWEAHQAVNEPYFAFENTPFGWVTTRLKQPTATATTETTASTEPLPVQASTAEHKHSELQEHDEEFWRVIQQQSDARHISMCLHEAVHGPEGTGFEALRAALREDEAAYNRTLTRLIGLVWTVSDLGADDVVWLEEQRLSARPDAADAEAYYKQVKDQWQHF
nr:helix-turn-helix transcriptional regulator [Hymenobacter guriensis]